MEERKYIPLILAIPEMDQHYQKHPTNEVKGEGLISCDTMTNISRQK
jgi:hypothetical protein